MRDRLRLLKGVRRVYYDIFSRFYDGFVAVHSRDKLGAARTFLVDRVPLQAGGSVLDLCTGTGTLLTYLQAKVGPSGQVVGVDFSPGMLKTAHKRTQGFPNVALVRADADSLPFAPGMFDAVTFSHVFYELKRETQKRAIQEIVRSPPELSLLRIFAIPQVLNRACARRRPNVLL
jgi:ubiquinone/menaquinone biosynthesis C-methylase UbiE